MNTTSDMIRKAAVLVSSLDDDMADKLLDQMPPAMADQVRRAMALLDRIDPAEQEAAIADFVRGEAGASSEPPDEDHDGVALSAKLAREFGLVAKTVAKSPASADSMADMTSTAKEQPFQSLRGEATSRISPLLADENPQTIALVAAHLPPAQALEILAALPLHVQSEVMRRMADLDEAHPDILREVDRGLALRMHQLAQQKHRRGAGLASLAQILEHAAPHVQQTILENLHHSSPELAEELARQPFACRHQELPADAPPELPAEPAAYHFSLDDLDDTTLTLAMQGVDAATVTLALAGSSLELVQRVAARLPPREAKRFRRALDRLGPTRLSDIAAAQQEVLAAANHITARNGAAGRHELARAA